MPILPVIVPQVIVGIIMWVYSTALLLQVPTEGNAVNLLAAIPTIAAFVWFTIQLAKIQTAQLAAHQATVDKLAESHQRERIALTELWMKWSDERNLLWMNFLTEERTIRREQTALVNQEMQEVQAELKKVEMCATDVSRALTKYTEYEERRVD